MEPKKYEGWLVSNSLLKRSFAVAGHMALAQLITAIPIWILFGILFSWFAPSVTSQLQPDTLNQILQAYGQE